MTPSRLVLFAPIVLAFLAPPSPAGIFSRKPQPNPAERVPELLNQLKTSASEDQRSAAAEELRQYDPKAFPEIVPSLIDALSRDASSGVRTEAASSLGKIRPISQQAGFALEQAQSNDSSMRVRLATRQAMLQFHLNGYRSGKPDAPPPASAANPSGTSTTSMFRPPMQNGQHPGFVKESAEPPLAPPIVVPSASVPVSRPVSPPVVQPIPANAPRLLPTPKTVDAPIVAAPATPVAPSSGPALPPPE